MLERLFDLKAHGTTARREVIAGITTFLTMAYITVVNPAILADAGLDFGAAFVATCLAAALGSALMGLGANLPVALAPGMGLNAYFAYAVVLGEGLPWQTALGAVVVSGLLFVVLSVLPVRAWLIASIPLALQHGVAAGIGLFLGLLGLRGAGLVVDDAATLVTMGPLIAPGPLLALGGLALIVALQSRRIPGAVAIGVLAVTVVSLATGLTTVSGFAAWPPSLAPVAMQADVWAALQPAVLPVVFAFLFVDLFDTTGTLLAVAHQGDLLDDEGQVRNLNRALLADSVATVGGGLLGTSTTTSYIESTAGIAAGGRTGLTALTVAVLFGVAVCFAPIAQAVPAWATAPALLYVAALMSRSLARLDTDHVADLVPAVLTALAIPFTFSIAHGIGVGFVAYALVRLFQGRPQACPLAVWVVAALFLAKLAWV